MTFPSNDLEIVLQAASRGETGVDSFVEALFASMGYFPVALAPDGGATLAVMTVGDQPYVSMFTSSEQASVAGVTSTIAEAPVREFMANVPAHLGIAVNPGGELGLPIAASTVQLRLGRGSMVPAGTRIRIGEPAEEPVQLLERIGAAFLALPAVRTARRCWAQVGAEAPGLVLGVDVDPDNPDVRESVIRAVGVANSEPGVIVNVVFANDGGEFVSWMRDHAEPFYTEP